MIGEPNIEQQPPIPWTFVNYFNSATEDQPVDSQRRIPLTHNHGVPEKAASGIYIIYFVECDYFDAPIFAPLDMDWINIRRTLAYCIINEQLLLS